MKMILPRLINCGPAGQECMGDVFRKQVTFTQKALGDLDNIYNWMVENKSRSEADQTIGLITSAALSLVESYSVSVPSKVHGHRNKLINKPAKFPYYVIFRDLPDKIEVARIKHVRQDDRPFIRSDSVIELEQIADKRFGKQENVELQREAVFSATQRPKHHLDPLVSG